MSWQDLFKTWHLRFRLPSIAAGLGLMLSCSSPTPIAYTLLPHEKALLMPGDFILRQGTGAWLFRWREPAILNGDYQPSSQKGLTIKGILVGFKALATGLIQAYSSAQFC